MVGRRLTLRDRIIGVLLRDARRQDRRSKADCAEALGVPISTIDAYEEGRKSISLPELEILGYVLSTPIAHFLAAEAQLKPRPEGPDFEAILGLRHRVVGALLRKARLEAGLTQEELADLLDCSSGCVDDYEHGMQSMPVAKLELLARHLDLPMESFLDDGDGTVGTWHRQQEIDRRFHELPADLQEFVTKPINIKYLEVAVKLSRMPASRLRSIAEGLLEITF